MPEPLRSALEAVVADYYAAYSRLDFAAARAHWDAEEPSPLCLPEEAEGFLRDWPALERYWADTRRTLTRLAVRHRELQARSLAPDLASADWSIHWDAAIVGRDAAVGGDVRVVATFRRRPDGWKLIHYVEAPLAPIIYVRRLYERSATPGFGAS